MLALGTYWSNQYGARAGKFEEPCSMTCREVAIFNFYTTLFETFVPLVRSCLMQRFTKCHRQLFKCGLLYSILKHNLIQTLFESKNSSRTPKQVHSKWLKMSTYVRNFFLKIWFINPAKFKISVTFWSHLVCF